MFIYMEVTQDKYELPVAVAGSVKELAIIRGITENAISSSMSHARKNGYKCKYVRVEVCNE